MMANLQLRGSTAIIMTWPEHSYNQYFYTGGIPVSTADYKLGSTLYFSNHHCIKCVLMGSKVFLGVVKRLVCAAT